MKYRIVLFDLDGTITDSSEGITSSVAYALDKKGISHEGKASLRHFIGPPLREQFMKCYGLDVDEGGRMVDLYREYYSTKGIYQCSVYHGIPELLRGLKNNGAVVVLATSKPEKFARIILDYFNLTEYFDFIAGANIDNTRTKKSEVIEYALESIGALCKEQDVVMIGDHSADIIGATQCGIDGIFVTYGFGDKEDGINQKPVAVFDCVEDLNLYLLG